MAGAVKLMSFQKIFPASVTILDGKIGVQITAFILGLCNGPGVTSYSLIIPFNFALWGGNQTAMNVIAIVLFSFAALCAAFLLAGLWTALKRKKQ